MSGACVAVSTLWQGKHTRERGKSSVEGTLKKLISRAEELQAKDVRAADKPKK